MIYPPISSLMKNMDSRFTLTVAVAKRARQLNNGAPKLTSFNSDKPVTIAIHEVDEGKIHYIRTRSGIK